MTRNRLHSTVLLFVAVAFALASLPCRGEDFIAGYHVDGKFLILGQHLRAPNGGIKPFAQLSPPEIATIYHEMWHAFFIECQTKDDGRMYRQFRAEVDRIYPSIPADKRMEVHEEAVADFIDAVIQTTVQIRRFLNTHAPEEREGILGRSRFPAIYAGLFRDSYVGYYTRSVREAGGAGASASPSGAERLEPNAVFDPFALDPVKALGPFVADARRARLPVGYILAASRRIRGVVFINEIGLPLPVTDPTLRVRPSEARKGTPPRQDQRTPKPVREVSSVEKGLQTLLDLGGSPSRGSGLQADVVMSTVPLGRKDMELVERDLFEGLLPEDPLIVFRP